MPGSSAACRAAQFLQLLSLHIVLIAMLLPQISGPKTIPHSKPDYLVRTRFSALEIPAAKPKQLSAPQNSARTGRRRRLSPGNELSRTRCINTSAANLINPLPPSRQNPAHASEYGAARANCARAPAS
jgi:hypothetical protein